MRWLCLLAVTLCMAQTARVESQQVLQGEVLKVHGDHTTTTARLNGKTIELFPQPGGGSLGLMPISVLQKPGPVEVDLLDSQGSTVQRLSVTVLNAHYAKQNVNLAPSIAQLHASPDEAKMMNAFRKELLPDRYWTDTLALPVPGCLTSRFGVERLQNGKPTGDFHAGLDQRAPSGSPIHAAGDGIVKVVRQFTLRGGTVAIDHGQGLQSVYLHMSGFAVKEGEHVRQGDVIGYIGSTGRSTGAHLHWALYANGEPINPAQWMKVPAPCTAPLPAPKRGPAAPSTR